MAGKNKIDRTMELRTVLFFVISPEVEKAKDMQHNYYLNLLHQQVEIWFHLNIEVVSPHRFKVEKNVDSTTSCFTVVAVVEETRHAPVLRKRFERFRRLSSKRVT